MKVTYTGKHGLTPAEQQKLEAKLLKLSKLTDRGGEKEAHVVLTVERHLHNAEITLNFYDHRLVGVGSDSDTFTAITGAIDKIEKQIQKQTTKWRDTKRTAKENAEAGPAAAEETGEDGEEPRGATVARVDHHKQSKPMTLEEALLAMEGDRDYMVYRDAETGRVSVLIRRRNGNFDLIEA